MKNKFNQFINQIKVLLRIKKSNSKYPLYCERDNWDIDYGYGHE